MVDLRTPDQRAALPVRREPYWSTLQQGCALGYRRGRKGGKWVARWRDLEGCKRYSSIGEADDSGHPGLSYEHAYEQALRVIVRSQKAELACAEPAQDGDEVIDEAAAGALGCELSIGCPLGPGRGDWCCKTSVSKGGPNGRP